MRVFTVHLKEFYPFLGGSGKDPIVKVYLPDNLPEMNRENDQRPTFVVCPGGAYAFCSEREAEPIALKFLDMGFNVFVLYYSVAPHRYPSQLVEVAAVFDYIQKNEQEFHCDIQKTGIIGFSAGGHLAAHYSNLWNDPVVKERFDKTYRPAASVLCYPVISTEKPHRESFENLLGHFPENADEVHRFSCEHLVNENTPPTFLFHTAEDYYVPVQNSLYYANALVENRIRFELHIYPFGPHGVSTSDNLTNDDVSSQLLYTGQWVNDLKKWLNCLWNLSIGGL